MYIQGPTGPKVEKGDIWPQGDRGLPGPASIDIGITKTVEPFEEAKVENVGTSIDDAVKSIVMTESTETVQITNPTAPVRNFTLMDASFHNIPIIDGQIILEDN